MDYHCRIELPHPLPEPFGGGVMWAKADLVYSLGFHRLDLLRTGRDATGRRKYLTPKLSRETLAEVRKCVPIRLGLRQLTNHPGFPLI